MSEDIDQVVVVEEELSEGPHAPTKQVEWMKLVREVRRETYSLLKLAPKSEKGFWRLVEARAKRIRDMTEDKAQQDVLEGVMWAGVAEHIEDIKHWRKPWEMWVLRRAGARVQQRWMSIAELSPSARVKFHWFVASSSVIFRTYYTGAVALLRFVSAVESLGYRVVDASEDEDVLRGIDCWIVHPSRGRMGVQVKSAGREHGSWASILEPQHSLGEGDSVQRAFRYLRSIDTHTRLLGVYVDVYEGGASHQIHEVDALMRVLEKVLFD